MKKELDTSVCMFKIAAINTIPLPLVYYAIYIVVAKIYIKIIVMLNVIVVNKDIFSHVMNMTDVVSGDFELAGISFNEVPSFPHVIQE